MCYSDMQNRDRREWVFTPPGSGGSAARRVLPAALKPKHPNGGTRQTYGAYRAVL
jgi:hypothetical protein